MSTVSRILKRRSRRKDAPEPGSTEAMSVADIAFLLLIFFIVTGSFILRQGVFFSLPSATASSVRVESRDIVDIYPLNENFSFNGNTVNRDSLYNSLMDIKTENPDIIMVINMAPEILYDRLVDTLSLAGEAGITRVSLKDTAGE